MSSNISFTMSNVASVAVMPINADATARTNGGSNNLVFAGVVVSQKGKPFEVIPVTADTWQDKLGKPYHASLGKFADSMRVLDEALAGGNGLVVRVVPKTATYPAVSFALEDGKIALTNEAISYSNELALPDGAFLAIAINDGAESSNRKMKIEQADAIQFGADMLKLTISEASANGELTTLEEKVFSLDPIALDPMGLSAYIETVLESSAYVACVVKNTEAKEAFRVAEFPLQTDFVGATNGDINTIASEDYQKAVVELSKTVKSFNYICGLGCYDDATIKELLKICDAKRISGYFDIDPRLSHAQATELKSKLGVYSHRASFVHFPYTAKCRFYGNSALWGLSGTAFKAKALGVAKSSPVGGWHFTPAGIERAGITRTNVTPLASAGVPDYEAMYSCRLNKIGTDENGTLFIDDSLTSYPVENYLRFEQVVSIGDAISRAFFSLGQRLKHQPDGITFEGLSNGMADILTSFEASGALVTPRNQEQDGSEAWRIKIEQVEIDYWKVSWWFCPTGSARRILGEPILIR